MASKNASDIGFEKQIWDAACVLRGNLDASEYKSVVLGLIFLKYISDRFEAKYNELAAEGDGFEEDQDEYTAENIFFVPESARWKVIAAAAHTPEVGTVIDGAILAHPGQREIPVHGVLCTLFAAGSGEPHHRGPHRPQRSGRSALRPVCPLQGVPAPDAPACPEPPASAGTPCRPSGQRHYFHDHAEV